MQSYSGFSCVADTLYRARILVLPIDTMSNQIE
jgi:hypothetical protein